MKDLPSPYEGHTTEKWKSITCNLINRHPLRYWLRPIVEEAWKDILNTTLGGYKIGIDIFPKPQIMGFFLHELIARKVQGKFPGQWRCEETAQDKDIVCIYDNELSIEIKTSSSSKNIYGNRSYSQGTNNSKKSKSGYYLAINFEKFNCIHTPSSPQIISIRFGWLDHKDWHGQASSTGQQARLLPEVESYKLLEI